MSTAGQMTPWNHTISFAITCTVAGQYLPRPCASPSAPMRNGLAAALATHGRTRGAHACAHSLTRALRG
jgi:hypothetical protein